MSKRFMITTFDNPCNPFTDFKQWFSCDSLAGYNTCSWLDHFAKFSIKDSDELIDEDVEFGANEFLKLNPFGIHYKVYEDEADTLIPLMNKTFKELNSQSS